MILTTAGVTFYGSFNSLYIKSASGPLQTLPRYFQIATDRRDPRISRIATGTAIAKQLHVLVLDWDVRQDGGVRLDVYAPRLIWALRSLK